MSHIGGLYWPDTIVAHKDFTIIGEKNGDILIYSKKHNKSYRFKGADVTACTQIKVKNDVLY